MARSAKKQRSMPLYEAILNLKDLDECCRFFDDLCTGNELRSMEQRFDVATYLLQDKVYLEIQEVREYTPETETHISYGRELWLALLDGIRGLGDFFGDLLIFLVGALPALLILGLIVFVIVKLVKKVRARRKAKKEALAKRFADPAPAPEEEKE